MNDSSLFFTITWTKLVNVFTVENREKQNVQQPLHASLHFILSFERSLHLATGHRPAHLQQPNGQILYKEEKKCITSRKYKIQSQCVCEEEQSSAVSEIRESKGRKSW
ncbi:pleckstrin protein [Trichinella spiralis]|uniref:pleckstrin protein n=1 Tax=Trichinella spiralis TaxID=6334 RepID=UPI0001EFBC1D|nr:pleckstrin protein [Trichinella spiralis]